MLNTNCRHLQNRFVLIAICILLTSVSLGSRMPLWGADEPSGHLRVSVSDRSTGQPISARCYLTDAKEAYWFPPGAIKYVKQGFGVNEQHFITKGGFEIDLPPSQYTLVVERGPEYKPASHQFEVQAGRTGELRVVVDHWINMNERGWYSGDLHSHRDWREVPELLLAEDLNVAPTITEWAASWENDQMKILSSAPAGAGPAIRAVDSTHVYSIYDTEVERPFGGGTVDLIGLDSPIKAQGYLLAPLDSVFNEQAHRQGGYVDAEKILYREIPALVAAGEIDFAGIVHNLFNRHGVILETSRAGMIPMEKPEYATPEGMALHTLEVYYRFLNCGFKLPVSAGSASGVMPSPLGYCRVYAHLPGVFSYREWFQTLKAGHSFATNGPMLFFKVNEREPGETIVVPAKASGKTTRLKVHAEASTAGQLDRLELVWKGQVVNRVQAANNESALKMDFEFDAKESGWLAARAFEKPGQTVHFAHTSPVFVQAGKESAVVSEDAKFFLAWIDREMKYFASLSSFHTEADRQAVLGQFQQARKVFEALATKNSPAPGSPAPR